MKRNKISGKQNICDLVPRAFSFFLILRDNVENGDETSLNIKKAKMLWKWDWKIWREKLTSLFGYFKKGNGKIEFSASRLSTKY